MSFRSTDTATSVITAVAWFVIALVCFLAVWNYPGMRFWFRVPLAVALAMPAVGFGIESLAQEMTVRRWAVGQLVFTTFATVFVVAGIFNADVFSFDRVVVLCSGGFFAIAAIVSGLEAKDLF